MRNARKKILRTKSLRLAMLFACALIGLTTSSQEKVSLSGTISPVACAAVCGNCCPSYSAVDTSGNITLNIGNAFVDIAKYADGGVYEISGYFYETTGQCGINQCTMFAVETVDQPQINAPVFDAANEKLSIDTVVINNPDQTRYSVTLGAPFQVDSFQEINEENTIPQGGDCSADNAICAAGTVCLSYFGIAGPQGPEFKTCEIPCSLPGANCPLGQSCQTIADGPGAVCLVD